MIRAAILGRRGRTPVDAVQGKTDEIGFVAAHDTAYDKVGAFGRDKALAVVADYAALTNHKGSKTT